MLRCNNLLWALTTSSSVAMRHTLGEPGIVVVCLYACALVIVNAPAACQAVIAILITVAELA